MKPGHVPEASFAHVVERLLDLYGWTWTHYEPAVRASGKWATPLRGHRGAPDYFAFRDERLIFAEIKSTTGKLSPAQRRWISGLERTGVEVYVWRPADVETVKETLGK